MSKLVWRKNGYSQYSAVGDIRLQITVLHGSNLDSYTLSSGTLKKNIRLSSYDFVNRRDMLEWFSSVEEAELYAPELAWRVLRNMEHTMAIMSHSLQKSQQEARVILVDRPRTRKR